MTPEDLEPLDPEDDAVVRRLLGSLDDESARMPDDVAARLDGVLADLVAERATATPDEDNDGEGSGPAAPGAPVTDLGERRRSRWPKVLVAAAAVSVLGLGIGNVMSDSEMLAGSDGEVATTADESGGDAGGRSQGEPRAPEGARDLSEDAGGRARLQSASLSADAQRLADSALVEAPRGLSSDEEAAPREDGGDAMDGDVPLSDCDLPQTGQGDHLVAVRLDGRPATLVFRKAEAGERQTDVYACEDATDLLAETVVLAR